MEDNFLHSKLSEGRRLQKDAIIESRSTSSKVLTNVYYMFTTMLLVLVFVLPVHGDVHVLRVERTQSPVFTTNAKFLSVALGSRLISENFKNFDMSSPKLQKLLAALSPGYLRIGGTTANNLWFVPKQPNLGQTSPLRDEEIDCSYEGSNCIAARDNFTMSGEQWLSLNRFASKAGLQILFDINDLTRNSDGTWDSSNAEKLIDFSSKHNLDIIWELGNEPTLYKNVHQYEISAPQVAKDFIKLRGILNKYPLYQNALLVGPDCSHPKPNNVRYYVYFEEFLKNAGNVVDAITWHQYNLNGRTAKYHDFLNPVVFDEFKLQIVAMQNTAKSAGVPAKKRMWLGETGSAYGGGAPGFSDRFIASFLWLDKLGIAAQYGLDVVIRQTFYRGFYGLLDGDVEPVPDYWISVMYKRLVGTKVVSCNSGTSSFVRLYCHCTKKQAVGSSEPSITVFGMNLIHTETQIHLTGLSPNPDKAYEYILTPDSDLLSKRVLLNNEELRQLPNGDIPRFKPRTVFEPYFKMPPFSIGFWVVPSPSISFC